MISSVGISAGALHYGCSFAREAACKLPARIPGAPGNRNSNSGHIVNLEQPDELHRAVRDFLASLPHGWEAGMGETKSLRLGRQPETRVIK